MELVRLMKSPCCVSQPIIARQRFCKHITAATNIQATVEDMLDVSVFYMVCALSKENRQLLLPRTSGI
jgi:hypothetical protein